jgi:hypothetical protein
MNRKGKEMDIEEFVRSSIPCPVSTFCYHLPMHSDRVPGHVVSSLLTQGIATSGKIRLRPHEYARM